MLNGATDGTAEALVLDLASLTSVRTAAETFLATGRALDVCVLNAGIMALPWKRTVDRFEQQWQVNVLGHFLLGRLLLPALKAAPAARMVHLASRAHMRHPQPIDYDQLKREHLNDDGFDRWRAYGRSKLANILFSNELARRLSASKVTSNAVHPGLVATELLTKAGGSLGRGIPVADGARTSIYLATSPEVEGQTGGYYYQCAPVAPGTRSRTTISASDDEARTLWAVASEQVGLAVDGTGDAGSA